MINKINQYTFMKVNVNEKLLNFISVFNKLILALITL